MKWLQSLRFIFYDDCRSLGGQLWEPLGTWGSLPEAPGAPGRSKKPSGCHKRLWWAPKPLRAHQCLQEHLGSPGASQKHLGTSQSLLEAYKSIKGALRAFRVSQRPWEAPTSSMGAPPPSLGAFWSLEAPGDAPRGSKGLQHAPGDSRRL